jgi:hypothetical protein
MKVRAFLLLLCFATLPAIFGSCSGDRVPTGTNSPDSLLLATRSAEVTLRAGSDSIRQSFTISGTESGIAWSAVSSAPWLRLSQSNGVTPSVVSATIKSDGLATGEHTAIFTIQAPTVDNSPIVVTVRLTVLAQAVVTVSPASLSFSGLRTDTELGPSPLAVSNSGTGTMQWTVTSAQPWIVITPTSGSGNGTVAVRVRTSGLATGTHNGSVVLAASGASGSPSTVPVALTISERLFAISVSADPANGGTVSGGGMIAEGSIATLQATPANGFDFVGWTLFGAIVSTSSTYSFQVTGPHTLVARFAAQRVNILTAANPTIGGTTLGGGIVERGTNVTVTASPDQGYSFRNWTENGAVVSTSPSYTFTALTNRTLIANFAVVPVANFTIATSSNPAAGGTTTGSGNAAQGAGVTVTATPNSGYTFTNWTENGAVVSTSPSYTFTAATNRTLIANFAAVFTIATSSNPAAGGTTSGSGSAVQGASVTVTATPNSGYGFISWTENGVVVSTAPAYTFTATASRTLVASFAANFIISTSSNAGGTTSGGGSVAPGSIVTVVATANPGYAFDYWVENGAVISTSASYTFMATSNRTLFAHFTLIPPSTNTVTIASNPPEGGTTSGSGTYPYWTNVTVIATPNDDYDFADWRENGSVITYDSAYTFTIASNRALVAAFKYVKSVVTTSSNPPEGGTTSGGGKYGKSANVTVTATPATGFVFIDWRENGVVRSNFPSYTFSAHNDVYDLVANFAPIKVTFTSPAFNAKVPGVPVKDSLTVQVRVVGYYEIASVTGDIHGRPITFSRPATGLTWSGTVYLVGLPHETLLITVTATDVRGNAVVSTQPVIYDTPPVVTVTLPEDNSVASPTIQYSATCQDDNPGCTLTFRTYAEPRAIFATGTGSISGTISLAAYQGRRIETWFEAVDSRGQPTSVLRYITVQ